MQNIREKPRCSSLYSIWSRLDVEMHGVGCGKARSETKNGTRPGPTRDERKPRTKRREVSSPIFHAHSNFFRMGRLRPPTPRITATKMPPRNPRLKSSQSKKIVHVNVTKKVAQVMTIA